MALLSTTVGIAVPYLPAFKNDKRAKNIAKEFRVGGMAFLANLLAERTVGDTLPIIENIAKNLFNHKPKQKIRIDAFKRIEFTPNTISENLTDTEKNNNIDCSKRKQLTLSREVK